MSDLRRTKGQVEAALTVALTQFERDFLGRGPKEARTYIIHDLVVVRLKGILSPAETHLSTEPGGVELIKQMRSRLIEGSKPALVRLVEEQTDARVTAMHTDLSTRSGERMFVFTVDRNLEELLSGP